MKVVDLFAGPGGLGEGFSSYLDSTQGSVFSITKSFEMDYWAHQTLELRAFRRQFDDEPAPYSGYLTGDITREELFNKYRAEARVAADEAHQVTLGTDSAPHVRALLTTALADNEPWVLIGGPPCQAYSLIGRSRNRGTATYVPETDHRQKLYVDYLQILADHAPAVFIMENVKGLLSARLDGDRLFERIRSDLSSPAAALKREGRPVRRRPTYRLVSLVRPHSLSEAHSASDFVVRAEHHGVPQARHRVILMGIREDAPSTAAVPLQKQAEITVRARIGDLPPVRSGLSRLDDSASEWISTLRGAPRRAWFSELDRDIRSDVRDSLKALRAPAADRGSNVVWHRGQRTLNHQTRAHIVPDLDRYMFAATFARSGRSPGLGDFPPSLLPAHRSAERALSGGHFADRFRVQMRNRPATTVTSHISKDGHYYIHYAPDQCRSLTVREAARLQTFPDDYFFCGPRTSQYQQVGNAVPPELARQIAGVVAHVLGR